MRIGVNCIGIDPGYRGGINTYVFGILNGFAATGRRHSFQIYVSDANRDAFVPYLCHANFELIVVPFDGVVAYFKRILAELTVFTFSVHTHRAVSDILFRPIVSTINRCSDLLYTPIPTLFPYRLDIPQVLSMHDIQQVHYPEFFNKHELISRSIRYRASAEHADYIQASSNYIKHDLLSHFSFLSDDQLVVITEGVAIADFRQQTDREVLRTRYNLPDSFFFLPAQLWHHKNHITVLKALVKIRDEQGRILPLVMTGGKFAAADGILRFIDEHWLSEQIYYLGKVPFEDIVALYQSSRCLLSASLHESSCLPALEAAAAGCPVIVSDIEPNREMSCHLAMNLFPALDHHSLASLMVEIWDNEALRRKQIEHNSVHVAGYSWETVTAKYLDFFTHTVTPTFMNHNCADIITNMTGRI